MFTRMVLNLVRYLKSIKILRHIHKYLRMFSKTLYYNIQAFSKFAALAFSKFVALIVLNNKLAFLMVPSLERMKILSAGHYKINKLYEQPFNFTFLKIADEHEYHFFTPNIFDEERGKEKKITCPAKWVAEVINAKIVPGFQVINDNNEFLVYEPAADPSQEHLIAGIWPYLTKGAAKQGSVYYSFNHKAKVSCIREGILISGRASNNYFHNIIEYFGKLYLFENRKQYANAPLIVDAEMHPQEYEALDIIAPARKKIRMSRDEILRVEKLHIPSIHTFHPDDFWIEYWKTSVVCRQTLLYLRNKVLSSIELGEPDASQNRIFLKKFSRKLVNQDAVEKIATRNGFKIIDPASMSFSEQVRVFFHAKAIMGQVGSAFTNLIFASNGCKVISLNSPFVKEFCMQKNIAETANCDYIVLSGEHPEYPHKKTLNNIFDDFSINEEKLERLINIHLI